MSRKIDVQGQVFGKRTVIKDAGRNSRGQVLWLTECACGRKDNVIVTVLRRTQCCRDCQMKPFKKHGDYTKRLYKIWRGMKQRCFNKNSNAYKYYGQRGITICNDWLDYKVFKDWSLKNGYKNNLTIDRIDADGNYEPNNCQWITIQEQNKAGKKRTRSDSTSSVTGVYYRKDTNKWFAGAGVNGKFVRSTCFDSMEEAVNARKELLRLTA